MMLMDKDESMGTYMTHARSETGAEKQLFVCFATMLLRDRGQ